MAPARDGHQADNTPTLANVKLSACESRFMTDFSPQSRVDRVDRHRKRRGKLLEGTPCFSTATRKMLARSDGIECEISRHESRECRPASTREKSSNRLPARKGARVAVCHLRARAPGPVVQAGVWRRSGRQAARAAGERSPGTRG